MSAGSFLRISRRPLRTGPAIGSDVSLLKMSFLGGGGGGGTATNYIQILCR
jgi:hypothetical protein